jgi:oligosaccharide repeat unit polymerase
VTKVVGAFVPGFEVPSHIGDYYYVPFPFNVATYLDVMYKDFGFFGILVLPAIFGFIFTIFFVRLIRSEASFWLLFINVIFALWIFDSAGAAPYLKPVYWFQIGAGFLIAQFVSLRAKQSLRTVEAGLPAP